jgi:hypothetical protein
MNFFVVVNKIITVNNVIIIAGIHFISNLYLKKYGDKRNNLIFFTKSTIISFLRTI